MAALPRPGQGGRGGKSLSPRCGAWRSQRWSRWPWRRASSPALPSPSGDGAHALPPRERARGADFCSQGGSRSRPKSGGTAILDGRQSPRRHAMAMLISLSHRDEKEITVLPRTPSGRSGLTANAMLSSPRLIAVAEGCWWVFAGRPGCVRRRGQQQMTDPLPGQSVGAWPGASHGRGTATKA
jgi:hypothetical protein